ncbi:heterogeneous nuclear ribonucleoprotein U-like protein 1 isoform X2 [Limulus polyphemus]|uniref:Heterogeneous nuclear ribonucleoprotein U-like protein 1 isoform X2 n=1 Tax=Limulus polyphemus TaxID=6850 RepID=A0ABM1SL21_LIMPO|nr:heterogeneous nuclear ribonucleoprotein U-like protein 1 isoform X2 [Limulus polyphemus]
MSDIDPSKLKVVELRAELQARGLDTKGNKAVLVKRLKSALNHEEKDDSIDAGDEISTDGDTSLDNLTTENTGEELNESEAKEQVEEVTQQTLTETTLETESETTPQNVDQQSELTNNQSSLQPDNEKTNNELTLQSDSELTKNELALQSDSELTKNELVSQSDSELTKNELVSQSDSELTKNELVSQSDSELTKNELVSQSDSELTKNELVSQSDSEQEKCKSTSQVDTERHEEKEKQETEQSDNQNAPQLESEQPVIKEEPEDTEIKQETPEDNQKGDAGFKDIKQEPMEEGEQKHGEKRKRSGSPEAKHRYRDRSRSRSPRQRRHSRSRSRSYERHKKHSRARRNRSRSRSPRSHHQRFRSRSRSHSRDRHRRHSHERSHRSSPTTIKREEQEETFDDSLVALDTYNSDLTLVIDKSRYSAIPFTEEGFAFMWSGVRATYGITSGRICFEVKVKKHLDVSHLPPDESTPHVIRVGFSGNLQSLQLGEEPKSYGYGGTAKASTNCKFVDYGTPFGEGDVITGFLNIDSSTVEISFAKNGVHQGIAYSVSKEELGDIALFPHILTKNCSFDVNFGQMESQFSPLPNGYEDYTFISCVPIENRVRGSKRPEKFQDCEMIMMCGLPACGKTTWALEYCLKHPEMKYNVLGTNNIIEKMRVMGLPRKRNYAGRWDVLIQMSTKCLNKMMQIGSQQRRNYILDQTNVYPSAQRRKMRPFEGFRRKAVVIVPHDEEFKRRREKQEKKEGKDVPDSAVLEMKANFELPNVGPLFDEVIFTDLPREEAEKLVRKYNSEGRAAVGPPQKRFRPNDQSPSRGSPGRGGYRGGPSQPNRGWQGSSPGGQMRGNRSPGYVGRGFSPRSGSPIPRGPPRNITPSRGTPPPRVSYRGSSNYRSGSYGRGGSTPPARHYSQSSQSSSNYGSNNHYGQHYNYNQTRWGGSSQGGSNQSYSQGYSQTPQYSQTSQYNPYQTQQPQQNQSLNQQWSQYYQQNPSSYQQYYNQYYGQQPSYGSYGSYGQSQGQQRR